MPTKYSVVQEGGWFTPNKVLPNDGGTYFCINVVNVNTGGGVYAGIQGGVYDAASTIQHSEWLLRWKIA